MTPAPAPALRVKIFADGAEKISMFEMAQNPIIAGFTTNPTLMRKAGIRNYKAFALDVLSVIKSKPISFEVFSDDFDEMERQAQEIASWAENVYVKIPITNTRRQSSAALIERLSKAGIKVNVTAILTLEQTQQVLPGLSTSKGAFVSVFAGRIADTGVNPLPMMQQTVELLRPYPAIELIWASPRQLLNVVEADSIGCHIITMTNELLKKMSLLGLNLDQYSLDTVKMFYDDAQAAGFELSSDPSDTKERGK